MICPAGGVIENKIQKFAKAHLKVGKNINEVYDLIRDKFGINVKPGVEAAKVAPPKTDEITRDELIATTENVETTGEAVQVSEEYRTARPEFKDLILSFKPGDDRHGTTMENYYGEIGGTEDADAMPIDVMLSKDYANNRGGGYSWIINQIDEKTGEFKQHKVMAGFDSLGDAEYAFVEQWGEDTWGSTFELTSEEFQEWRDNGDHKVSFEPQEKVPDAETAAAPIAPSSDEKVPASDAANVSPEDFDAMLADTETEAMSPEEYEAQTGESPEASDQLDAAPSIIGGSANYDVNDAQHCRSN